MNPPNMHPNAVGNSIPIPQRSPVGGMQPGDASRGLNAMSTNAFGAPTDSSSSGAGALQLSGRWELDKDESDSTNDYLEAMGLPLIARQAADKLALMVIINQTPNDFTITRYTRIFTETKTLRWNQEVNVKGNLITVYGDPTHIRTETELSGGRGHLTDVRTIDERGKMKVELKLVVPDKTQVIIRRMFHKSSESTSLENLPQFDISQETAGETKRKR